MVVGLLAPSAGRVLIGGHDMATDSVAAKKLLVGAEKHVLVWPVSRRSYRTLFRANVGNQYQLHGVCRA